jgi:hypothetical protein
VRTSRAVGRVLVRSVAEHDWAAPPPGIDELVRGVDLSALPAASAFHGVAGCVYHSLRGNRLVDAETASVLEATHHRARLTHLQTVADLRTIVPVLDGLGAPWIVVKGPVLASLYTRADLRGYTDLDIVVAPEWLGRALDALEAAGARVVDANWELMRRTMSGQVHMVMGRTGIDLHWHLLNDARLRDAFSVPVRALYQRARRVDVDGLAVPTLDPVDTVLHLALHATISGGNRLVWLKDVEQTAPAALAQWDELLWRGRESGAALAVATMFDATREVLGAPIPVDAIRTLAGGRAWTELAAVARRVAPIQAAQGRRSPVRLVTRATRRGVAGSALQLFRRAGAAVGRPTAPWPHVVIQDPDNPVSTAHAAGNREEFLEAVRRDGAC